MRKANWEACPYIHYVELDFVSGAFIPGRASVDHSMYGGFGVALMLPEKREFDLRVFESQREKFEIIHRFAHSSGYVAEPTGGTRKNLLARIKTRVRTLLRTDARC
jgi:hypothetical protein